MIRRPPRSPLFPYTTLSRSAGLVTGPAVILVLLAAVSSGSAEIITSAALVILFLLVTSPLSTHAIAQAARRSEEHTSELQSRQYLVCRLLLEKKTRDPFLRHLPRASSWVWSRKLWTVLIRALAIFAPSRRSMASSEESPPRMPSISPCRKSLI